LGLLVVVGVAILVRAWHLDTWSLWEDEEGSMTLAQKPYDGFQGYFPIYFVALNQQMRWTGLSVGAARALPALMGVLSIAMTCLCFRRYTSSSGALLAGLLLALNLGHLFFSQSVRYYTTALVFQVLALYWFFDGLERDRPWRLLLANVAFVLGLLTHFSVVLIAPVFVGYLLLAVLRGESGAGYRLRNYLSFCGVLVIILTFFAFRILQMRNLIGGWAIPAQRDPIYICLNVLAYFGVPLLGLGLLAPWLARGLHRRTLLFLLCIAILPVLELVVIAWMNVVNVTWYYGLIAQLGFALLAGQACVGQWEQGRHRFAALLGVAAVTYYLGLSCVYHLQWYGDRPRWGEAALWLRQERSINVSAAHSSKVYASVPGVVAFYLGADPRQQDTRTVVKSIPSHPTDLCDSGCWFVVEAKLVSPEYEAWFSEHCSLRARFEAMTGPIDRSVLVYERTYQSNVSQR
jgi:uncharacterized membrane protein